MLKKSLPKLEGYNICDTQIELTFLAEMFYTHLRVFYFVLHSGSKANAERIFCQKKVETPF
ncbi:MAG: hypothetical protein CK547_00245 [Chitinophagaceae bacterium]|nr:MAG: hypothetical protein CK547_00245 [Chitinophagaceae bacterium]